MRHLNIRRVFSDAALARLDFDEPVSAMDPATGILLHYRFEPDVGGVLRLFGPALGIAPIVVGCTANDINTVSTLLLDGIRLQIN